MTVAEFYEAVSGDYAEATKRLMKDSLILKFIQKFPADPSFAELKAALEAGDTETAFRQAHTLKGVCANLAFTQLTASASEITEFLRAGKLDDAKACFPKVSADYETVITALEKVE
ncbi:MAG: Hpt domain-containing protein [Parasporobacterium sp.]|nr:Hpt domain-containing protein [Parasporobacterium sp.]